MQFSVQMNMYKPLIAKYIFDVQYHLTVCPAVFVIYLYISPKLTFLNLSINDIHFVNKCKPDPPHQV